MRANSPLRSKLIVLGPLLVVALLLLAVAGVGGFLYVTWEKETLKSPSEAVAELEAELPPLENPHFRNTSQDATYVGIETCTECHSDQFHSYQLTAHSQALSRVDPMAEPPDAEFVHSSSGRSYQVYRKEGELRHHEFAEDEKGVIAEQDFAMDWLIGSGHHSRSYLVNVDGFLVESPVTWYAQREAWDVSPGYDEPHHAGFERAADEGCIICHVGHMEAEGDSLSRLEIREAAIGCERCHGPGSLHVARWRGNSSASTVSAERGADPTIVHPGRLERRLAEDICSQCHLRGDASVTVRNRRLTDFRPGMPLTHVRVDYQLKAENRPMKVVGHVEQMRLSKCWQADESTLTCTTCHNPHQDTPPRDKVAFFRSKCLQCHSNASCGLPESDIQRTKIGDNCAQCHMPQVDTDIPHIAFTHHRIGLHGNVMPPSTISSPEAKLIPTASMSHLADIDQDRCRGLAYLEYADKQSSPVAAREFRNRAFELLLSVHRRGLHDGDTDAALARILWEQDSDDAIFAAQSALAAKQLSPQSRINIHFILADMALRKNQPRHAMDHLEQLARLRRHSEDQLMLASCYADQGRFDRAIEEGERALQIHPFRTEIYRFLVEVCEKSGQTREATEYTDQLERLQAAQQQNQSSNTNRIQQQHKANK